MENILINDTSDYYKNTSPSLLNEITICQCLSSLNLPYIKLLNEKKTYGDILASLFNKYISTPQIIVEIGGGHGTLMKSLLTHFSPKEVYMNDISNTFLEKQKETLKNFKNIYYIKSDLLLFLEKFNKKIDQFICNEVIGDLNTVLNIDKSFFAENYNLDTSYLPDKFNFNNGAIELIKKLKNKIDVGFISEHSSTYKLPYKFREYLKDERIDFSPRKISLFGHDEYTINFKMLKEFAEKIGFKTIRKHLLEILPLRFDKLIKFVLKSKSHQTDFHEIIYEFYNHVKEYEFLILL